MTMTVCVKGKNGSVSFESTAGERILYSALSSGLSLPHECISGTCGSCRATLKSGKVHDLWCDAPGKKFLRPGDYLLCQCAATENCEFEVKSEVRPLEASARIPKLQRGIIQAARILASDVMSFSIELMTPVDFEAGQFFAVQFPGLTGFRCYSMVNYDSRTSRLDFVIKRKIGGGVSEWLFANNPDGQEVECFGPVGAATFNPEMRQDILCIAGGSGIAGMMSILSRAAQAEYFNAYRGYVFFGVRSTKEAFFLTELTEFVRMFPERLQITVALSEETPSAQLAALYPFLRFEVGTVTDVARRRMKSAQVDPCAYIAGPPVAVEAAIRMLLLELKLKAGAIRYDKFG